MVLAWRYTIIIGEHKVHLLCFRIMFFLNLYCGRIHAGMLGWNSSGRGRFHYAVKDSYNLITVYRFG